MKNCVIRINKLKISNIKNVKNGEIYLNKVFPYTYGASVVGVYGQNGSGKTALIWAMEIVKDAISGSELPKDSAYYIRQGSASGTISIEFLINLNEREYTIFYSIELSKTDDNQIAITYEGLEYSAKSNENHSLIKRRKILEINYPISTEKLNNCFYKPDNRISEFGKEIRQTMLIIQALAREKRHSFIFNKQIVDIYTNTGVNELHLSIINALMFYGNKSLFVLNRQQDSTFNMFLLPLSLRIKSINSITKSDAVPISLGRNVCNKSFFSVVEEVIKQIDTLINKIVPGLHIEIVNIEKQLNENGDEGVAFELASNRDGVVTPLRYESEGIKKILCNLSSLISMYNDESVFVAIDELDAGVFEYLLGEILEVIRETGEGQLLFTAHNFRPLELLDHSNVYLTTTNPDNKYIQFIGIKQNHNLRDQLFRTIVLGGQKESIYETTKSHEIRRAFRDAWEPDNE